MYSKYYPILQWMQHVTVSEAQKLHTCFDQVLTVRFAQHKSKKTQKINK